VRVAVLGSSVRPAASRHALRNAAALKRRVVLGVLVGLSLLMITLYFRESPNGGLHALQDAGATVLRPFQVAAERVVRPFRDAYGYVSDVSGAKAENERLRSEIETLRQQVAQYRGAWDENQILRAYVDYKAPPRFPQDYDTAVVAAVVARPSPQFQQRITISAGSEHGVQENDPVMGRQGLVGLVTDVSAKTAQVTLLSDGSSAVSAEVVGRDATGLIVSGSLGGELLALDLVGKQFEVRRRDLVMTAGSRIGQEPSFYPRGIPIGVVTFVSQRSTEPYKTIQVEPHEDFDALQSVKVLITERDRDAR
jgi:rod shape-determining protein MreC